MKNLLSELGAAEGLGFLFIGMFVLAIILSILVPTDGTEYERMKKRD